MIYIYVAVVLSVAWTVYDTFTHFVRGTGSFAKPYWAEHLITNLTMWWIVGPISLFKGQLRKDIDSIIERFHV